MISAILHRVKPLQGRNADVFDEIRLPIATAMVIRAGPGIQKANAVTTTPQVNVQPADKMGREAKDGDSEIEATDGYESGQLHSISHYSPSGSASYGCKSGDSFREHMGD